MQLPLHAGAPPFVLLGSEHGLEWRLAQPRLAAALTRFGAGEFHHLAPLLDLFGQDLGEIRAAAGQDQAAEVGEASLDPRNRRA
jgi:hypothetical protein